MDSDLINKITQSSGGSKNPFPPTSFDPCLQVTSDGAAVQPLSCRIPGLYLLFWHQAFPVLAFCWLQATRSLVEAPFPQPPCPFWTLMDGTFCQEAEHVDLSLLKLGTQMWSLFELWWHHRCLLQCGFMHLHCRLVVPHTTFDLFELPFWDIISFCVMYIKHR